MDRSRDYFLDWLKQPAGASRQRFFDERLKVSLGASEGVSLVDGHRPPSAGVQSAVKLLASQVQERRQDGEMALLKVEPRAESLKCFVVLEGAIRWWPDNTRPQGVEVGRGGVFGIGAPWGEAPHAWTQRVRWWWSLRRRNREYPTDAVPRTVAGFRWPGHLHAVAVKPGTVVVELRWVELLNGDGAALWEEWAALGGGCEQFLARAEEDGWFPLLDQWESHTPFTWSERQSRGAALVRLRRTTAPTETWPLDSPDTGGLSQGVFCWPNARARHITLIPSVYVRLSYPPTLRQASPLHVTTALAGPRLIGDFEYVREVQRSFLSCSELLIGADAGARTSSAAVASRTILLSEIAYDDLDRLFERGEDADLAGPFFRSVAKRAVDGLAARNTRPSPAGAMSSWLLAGARRHSPTGLVDDNTVELISREVPMAFLEAKFAYCLRLSPGPARLDAGSSRAVRGPMHARRLVLKALRLIEKQCHLEARRHGYAFQHDVRFDVNREMCRMHFPSLFDSSLKEAVAVSHPAAPRPG